MTSKMLATAALAAWVFVLQGCMGQSEAQLLEAARLALKQQDTKTAVIHLKTALQKNPDSGTARFLLGKTMGEAGDPAAAVLELRKARDLDQPDHEVVPELARNMLMIGEHSKVLYQFNDVKLADTPAADLSTSLAMAHLLENDNAKADTALRQALQAQPGYAPAVTLQARMAAAAGDIASAMALLETVLAADAGHAAAGVLKGDLLRLGKGDLAGASDAYRKVLAAHPESLVAHSGVMRSLLQQGATDEAKTQFALMKKTAPAHPETLFYEAQLAFGDKNYKLARETADRILKVAPNDVRTLELAGAAELRQKAYPQAEAFLSQALKLAPGQLQSRHLLAQIHLRGGQPERALETLQPVLDTGKVDVNTLQLAGEAHLQMGDAKRAEGMFQLAAKAAPQSARARTSVALAQLARGGNNAAAISSLEVIAAEDQGPRADLALISARLQQKDLAGAAKAVDALQKKQPDAPLADNLRGRIRLLQGDTGAAETSFKAALVKEPQNFPAAASLSAIELAAGKPELAKQRLEAFLVANPKSVQAKLALAELSARTGAPAADVGRLIAEAVKINPDEPRPHLLLVNHHLAAGDAKAALSAAQSGAATLPASTELQDALGRAQLAAGDARQALTTFKKLAAEQPKRAQHQLRLAEAFAAEKDLDNAGLSLRRALELQPDLAMAKVALVRLALQRNQPQDAKTITAELQKADPKNPLSWALAGDVEAFQKNWDGAASAYRAALQRGSLSEIAIKLHQSLGLADKQAEAQRFATDRLRDQPNDAAFRFYLGDWALAQNDMPTAELHYRSVMALQPKHALAMNNVAWLLVKQGKSGGLALATQANELAPDRAPLLDTLATALAAEGKLPQAIETQKEALLRAPKDPSLKLNLARIYAQAGDKSNARVELEALAALGDEFRAQPEVQAMLKQMR